MQINQSHPGLFHCPFDKAVKLMPDIQDTLYECPIQEGVVDVKIHMLMPNMYPCIPNWHCDFIPRDKDNIKQPQLIDTSQKMYLWLSGDPLTEFKDGREIKPRTWIQFNQTDVHRGTVSKEHCWRMFIRVVPYSLCKPAHKDKWLRRHTQVYLDSNSFTW